MAPLTLGASGGEKRMSSRTGSSNQLRVIKVVDVSLCHVDKAPPRWQNKSCGGTKAVARNAVSGAECESSHEHIPSDWRPVPPAGHPIAAVEDMENAVVRRSVE